MLSQEQLDAVKRELADQHDNEHLKQSIYRAFLEHPERGAETIIKFASEKGLKLSSEDAIRFMKMMILILK